MEMQTMQLSSVLNSFMLCCVVLHFLHIYYDDQANKPLLLQNMQDKSKIRMCPASNLVPSTKEGDIGG